MSNANALATVTAALASALAEVASTAVDGSRVFIGRPERRADPQRNEPSINIFLYQATVNPNWRNADAPTRDSKGRLIKRPAIGLDLNYMLTFYGPGFVPQILMGHTISRLHARPLLSQINIAGALGESGSIPGDSLLKDTDLDQFEMIRFSPMHFTLDEMSRLWSVFFQTPYDLSIAYQASVVLIEAMDLVPQPALPVLGVETRVSVGAIPQIEQIDPPQVTATAAKIRVKGQNLAVPGVKVRFGGLATPATPEIAGPDLAVALPPGLSAGIIPVSVDAGGIVSNAAVLVLRPEIVAATYHPKTSQITLDVRPPMQPNQRGFLLLNARLDDITSEKQRQAYALPLPQPVAATSMISVDGSSARPGKYLVRVQIDGAESPLAPPPDGTVDAAFTGPTVTIP